MPFGPLLYPSIGLSLLKAALTRDGIPSRIHYFTLDFAEIVGSRFYTGVAGGMRPQLRHLAGEWIFSSALFPRDPERDARYAETNLRRKPGKTAATRRRAPQAQVQRLFQAREVVGPFLERCVDTLLRDRPRVVGLTSVFQQQTAALALAKRIKRASPDTFIVIGGANCEGIMGAETVRQFPFVDATVSGEGDLVISELVRRVLSGASVDDLPGVRTQSNVTASFETMHFSNAPTVLRMDDLPFPDYDDYFEQFETTRFARYWQPGIFFETSRGCWWGEKAHCTFCGLNGATMTFRPKSAERAMNELLHLTNRHEGADVEVTDNILDLGYFKDFVPQLARLGRDFGLLYETKSNLRKEQVRQLRDGGILRIQPGIESLNDDVLKLMRKGVSALQNIQLLKWCKELGVFPRWNILWGFPGESPDSYAQMAATVPLLTHLRPPGFFATIRMDRFSPNFFDSDRLGFKDVTPLDAYEAIYQLPPEAIRNLAYYFKFDYRESQDLESYARPLSVALTEWQRVAESSDFFSVETGEHLILWDLRPVARRAVTVLSDARRLLYLACDAARDPRQLSADLVSMAGLHFSTDEIAAMLAPMVEDGLMLRDGLRYLALAIPLGEYVPARPVVDQFCRLVRGIGEPSADGIVVRWKEGQRKGARPRRSPQFFRRSLSSSRFTVDGPRVLIH